MVAIAPFCLITEQISARPVAGHRLYFASIGVGLLVAGIFTRGTRTGVAGCLLVLIGWASLSTQQHPFWASSRALWSRDRETRPRARESRLGLANWYVDRGRYQAAARELNRALTRGPVTADLLGNLGQVYLEQGRDQRALTVLLKSAQLGETAETANALGIVYERLGKRDDAIAAYRRATALDPANVDARHNLGNCYSQMGDAVGAAKCYRAAIQIDPDAVLSQMALGRVYYYSGALDEARQCFEAALRGPTLADAHAMLGLIALEQGAQRDARQHLQLALQRDPTSWYAHLLAAEIAESLGDTRGAIAAYERVLQLRPEKSAVRERLSELRREAQSTGSQEGRSARQQIP